ncbi:MAG: hypothetical protein JWN99_77, partial [Ilumatobacteraceae bacterium]|nr:hypothetical protein [Ilumatobacteraceae bacterium]
ASSLELQPASNAHATSTVPHPQ